MTVTSAQVTTLLENVLFESTTLATANAVSWTAIANLSSNTSTVAGLSSYLASQPEAQIAEQVVRYYQGALGRVPSPSEIAFYVNYAETGLSAQQIAQGASAVSSATWGTISAFFTNSPEFKADYGLTTSGLTAANEATVITGFYNNILGRAPTSSEITFYENALTSGASLATLVEFFANSPEYQLKANATIQGNLTSAGVTAVATVAAGGTPLTSTAPIGPLPSGGTTTVALTAGLDTLAPTGNATVTAILDGATASDTTLTALDSIDGSGGNVTVSVTDLLGTVANPIPTSVTLKNIAVLDWTSAGAVTLNITSNTNITGLKEVDVLKGTFVNLTVGDGTSAIVNSSGSADVTATDSAVTVTAGGSVSVNGGSTITVTGVGAITVVGGTASVGAITVTDTGLGGAHTLSVQGGSSVSVTSTNAAGGGTINVGTATAPTGAVTVIDTNSYKATLIGDAINVKGGTTVTVTDNLAQAGAIGTTFKTTAGAIGITGTKTTTTVSVTENAAVTAVAGVKAVTGVAASDVITFSAVANGSTATVGSLVFKNTSGSAMTAAQVASAFANLTSGSTAGSSSLGTFSGSFSQSYSSGAVTTASGVSTVTFTESGTPGAAAALAVAGGAADSHTAGTAAVTAVTGVGGIIDGAVTVNDGGTASITSVTVNGFNGVTLGANKGLTTLSLANGAGAGSVSDAAGGATSLALTLNGDALTGLTLDAGGAIYTSLAITTATADSTVPLTAAGVTALTVAGTNHVDLTGSTLTALKTVTVSGSAGVTLSTTAGVTTDVNASATSGSNTVTITSAATTFEGGSGNDTVILGAIVPTKAISGGAGTNTVSLDTAAATTESGSATFASEVTGFTVLKLTTAVADTVSVNTLGSAFTTVSTGGAGGLLDLDGLVSGDTLVLTSAVGAGSYSLTNTAWTGAAPAALFNIDVTAAGGIAAGSVTAAHVTSLNLVATDTTAHVVAGTNTDTLTLVATAATSITVSGNANLTLTSSADTALTSINASAMTGGLNATAAGTVAETITGSSTHANTLAAATGATTADVLIGGAGADTITANKGLDTLTGGGGNDTFVIVASQNVNSYATITDAHAGNIIEMTGATSFVASKISLAGTAVFQDYANAAVTGAAAHTASWFQYGGDTYIIENVATESTFLSNTDFIVKLAGLHDLSTAGFNTTVAGVVLHS